MAQCKMETKFNKSGKIYKIKKGFCLIVNTTNSDTNEKVRINGSKQNVKKIKETFEHYGFQVNDYYNFNNYGVISLIDEQVNHEKCKSFDAFVLYICTQKYSLITIKMVSKICIKLNLNLI